MHVARQPINHPRVRRSMVVEKSLEGREPALINLPIPLPSIPILDPILKPILTPIIDGPTTTKATSTTVKTTSTTSPAQTTAASTPTPTVGTGDSGSSGNSGSGTGDTSSGGSNGGGTDNGGTTGGDSSSSGSSGNTGSGSGSSGDSGGNSGASGGDGSSSNAGSSSPSSGLSSGSVGSGAAATGSGSINSADGTAGAGTADPSGTVSGQLSGQTLLANAGDAPTSLGLGGTTGTGTVVKTTVYSDGIPIATYTSSVGGGGTNTDGTGSTDPGSESSQDNKHSGISTGIIISIVVVAVLLLFGFLIVFFRRRSASRRNNRRNRWWFGRSNANDNMRWSSGSGDATAASGTISARSSFATTYDIGHRSSLTLDYTTPQPPLPPMAQLRDGRGHNLLSIQADSHVLPVDLLAASPTQAPSTPLLISFDEPAIEVMNSRFSVASSRSTSSDPHSQYVVIRSADTLSLNSNNNFAATPMSVRPFSPSESFAFPKPPPTSGEWGSLYSKRQSANNSSIMMGDAAIPPTPALPTAMSSGNPFLDPSPQSEFAEIEMIRRPFAPTLHDELRVEIGDRVKISAIYDDGWALVQVLPTEDDNGKGKTPELHGLIPIDCLREPGQDLPAFLASKRVSSYSATGVVAE